jgi:hypothetical protein
MVERPWDWMRWVETQTGVKSGVYRKFHVQEASGLQSVARMTEDEWTDFDGWCGDQHVPKNEHWEPGKLDIERLLRIKRPGTPRCEAAGWLGVNAI